MRLKRKSKTWATCVVLFLCVIQCKFADSYRTQEEITLAPPEEATTKKSGFFSGFKNFFSGSTSTTPTPISTTNAVPARPKLPSLPIPQAPLLPLRPRPDTPSSPVVSNQQQPPQWPQYQPSSSTNINNFKSKSQPSPFDLSYGHSHPSTVGNSLPQNGFIAVTPSTTTTTTTAAIPPFSSMNGNTRADEKVSTTTKQPKVKEDFPPLPPIRSTTIKQNFPALPTPSSAILTPNTSNRPPSPSAWGTPSTPGKSPFPSSSTPKAPSVAFVPHTGPSSTTARPPAKVLATDEEIEALTEILYTKEVNSQLSHVSINLQGKTRSIDSTDQAPQPLLTVDAKALETPSIAKMRLLFNNYEEDTMTNEHVTANERKEESDFLDVVMASSVMRQAMQFLQNKGIVMADPKTHRDLVREIWFTQYSRGNGRIGSSGFEHVFVHEVKNGTLIGLHNWVYFNEEEQAGRLDYKGYIYKLDLGNKAKILKVRFSHKGVNKPVNTLFIGTSPELELALYTVCFKLRPDSTCPVSLGNSKFGIVTWTWRYRGKHLIGSAFPEI